MDQDKFGLASLFGIAFVTIACLDLNLMPDTLALEKLQPELFPEEKLLWSGRPVQGLRFRRSDFAGYAVATFLLAVILVLILITFDWVPTPESWKDGSTTLQAKISCVLWSIILLPVVIYWLGGGQWLDAYMRSCLFYGVTNERILILRDTRRNHQSLISLRIHDVPHLSLIIDQDGTGSLSFVPRAPNAQNHPPALAVCFRLISEVRKVYALIRSIQRESA